MAKCEMTWLLHQDGLIIAVFVVMVVLKKLKNETSFCVHVRRTRKIAKLSQPVTAQTQKNVQV